MWRRNFPARGSGFPTILSVYGEKGEMERAGRRWLAHAAPPPGRVRRRESRAIEDGLGWWVRSGVAGAPGSGAGRPGSSLGHRRTSGPSAPGSGGPATRCAPRRRGAVTGAPGLRGRTEAAGNSVLGARLCLSGLSTPGVPRRTTSRKGGCPRRGCSLPGWGGAGAPPPRLRFRAGRRRPRLQRPRWKAPCATGSRAARAPPPSSPFPDPGSPAGRPGGQSAGR